LPLAEESSGSQPKPLIIKSPPDLGLEDRLRRIAEAKGFSIIEKKKGRIIVEFVGNSQF